MWFLGNASYGDHTRKVEREYNLSLITTAPTVVYEVTTTNNNILYVDSPAKLPAVNDIDFIGEPIARCNILVPSEYLGNVITLCVEKRNAS